MKIVVLDGVSITPGEDLKWDGLAEIGDLDYYPQSTYEECFERMKGAEAVFFSKIHMDRRLIEANPQLRFLGVTATGFDNLDIAAARDHGIACTNVPGYAGDAVAQHTIGLILEMTNQIGLHNDSVHSGEWTESSCFCYTKTPLTLLAGKSLGIIGYGNIGRKVAAIGKALGMKINIYSRDREAAMRSDFVSLHVPAAPDTIGFINDERISQMKDGARLINTARGVLVDEDAVARALDSGKLAGFAADVLAKEPPAADDPLIHHPKCIITPHNSWCPLEARAMICRVCAENLESFLSGGTLNRIDL